MDLSQLTVIEYLVWVREYALENFKGDVGLAMLELELQGMLD